MLSVKVVSVVLADISVALIDDEFQTIDAGIMKNVSQWLV